MSGCFQASVIALVVGFILRNVSAPADAAWWPYVPFGYAFLAVVVPWLLLGPGDIMEVEFHPGLSLLLGITFALPFHVVARWLADSPYPALVTGCRIMVALWGIHVLISCALCIRNALRKGPAPVEAADEDKRR